MTRTGKRKYPWLWGLVPGTDLAQQGPLLSLCDAHELCQGSLVDGWRGPDLLCNQLLHVPATAMKKACTRLSVLSTGFSPRCGMFLFCSLWVLTEEVSVLGVLALGHLGSNIPCKSSLFKSRLFKSRLFNVGWAGNLRRNNETRCFFTAECSFEGFFYGWQCEPGGNLGSQTSVGIMLLRLAVSSDCSDDDEVAEGRVLGDVDGP
jgi:hypothetical protein